MNRHHSSWPTTDRAVPPRPLHLQRLACQAAAFAYRCSHSWQDVPPGQVLYVAMPGLLPTAVQQTAADSAPVFWQPAKNRLSGDLSGYDGIYAAGGQAAEEQCGNSMLGGIAALRMAAGGDKEAKALAEAIADAAQARQAGHFDDPELQAVKEVLNGLNMSVAVGSKDGPTPDASDFAAALL